MGVPSADLLPMPRAASHGPLISFARKTSCSRAKEQAPSGEHSGEQGRMGADQRTMKKNQAAGAFRPVKQYQNPSAAEYLSVGSAVSSVGSTM